MDSSSQKRRCFRLAAFFLLGMLTMRKSRWSVKVLLLLLTATCPWEAAAKLRSKQSGRNKWRKEQGFGAVGFGQQNDDDIVEIIVGLNIDEEESSFTEMSNTVDLLADSVSMEELIPQIKAGVVRVPKGMLESLQTNPKVKYFEPNGNVYENSETVPRSISKSWGTRTPLDLSPTPGLTFECSDPNSFRVAILDGGIDASHYDFEYCGIFDENGQVDPNRETHCMGRSFLTTSDANEGQDWYNTKREHGMHVAGTLAASGMNDAGVAGMISDEKVCLVVARVFGDGGGASVSKVAEAIVWAADTGAKVINMSIGTSNEYQAVTAAIEYAHSRGAILIASSGNGADDDPPTLTNYPADYDSVISVAAVDKNYEWAPFSNYNENVDLSAVGVDVLSSYPLPADGTNFDIVTSVGTFSGTHMMYSRYTSGDGVTGILLDCGFGSGLCPGSGGHICLIKTGGSISFFEKVLMCQKSNGVAAIIYSDDDEDVTGSMGQVNTSPRFTSIPAVGTNQDTGLQLRGNAVGSQVTLTGKLMDGFGTMSGTSMAVPHVAGAAALLWRACADCSRENVVQCLLTSTDDVGPVGKDIWYGSGVLNTAAALKCLKAQSCCATLEPDEASSPSYAPTKGPTKGPTNPPTLTTADSPPASSNRSICDLHCDDKARFCEYKASVQCNIERGSCIGNCVKAVSASAISSSLLSECQMVWCPAEMENCVTRHEVVCENEHAACQQRC